MATGRSGFRCTIGCSIHVNVMKEFLIASIFLLSNLAFAQSNSSMTSAQPKSDTPPTQRPAKLDPTTEADIRKLLTLTGTDKLADQMMNSMESSIRPLMTSSLPPGDYRETLVDLFFQKFHSKAAGQQIIEMAIPVYANHYTDGEVKQLIAFYGTPLGQKTVQITPQLMTELQKIGQEWGGNLGRQCMSEVLAEHPELEKAMDQAAHPPKQE